MRLMHAENYEAMSKEAVDLLLDIPRRKPDAVTCFVAESSPVWMCELVYEVMDRERVGLPEITLAELDEWYGVEPQTACTYTTFIREHLPDQLYMQSEMAVELVSDVADIRQKLDRTDVFLSGHSIDAMVLRLGINGHLGLNEPVGFPTLDVHYAELDEGTRTHDMVKGYEPKGGLTIRLWGIFTSGQILILVCGDRKEAAYQVFMSQRIATSTPASLLWLYPDYVVLVGDTIQK